MGAVEIAPSPTPAPTAIPPGPAPAPHGGTHCGPHGSTHGNPHGGTHPGAHSCAGAACGSSGDSHGYPPAGRYGTRDCGAPGGDGSPRMPPRRREETLFGRLCGKLWYRENVLSPSWSFWISTAPGRCISPRMEWISFGTCWRIWRFPKERKMGLWRSSRLLWEEISPV